MVSCGRERSPPRLQPDRVPESRLQDSPGQWSLAAALVPVHTATSQGGPFPSQSPVHTLIKQGLASDPQNECAMALIPACSLFELRVLGPMAGWQPFKRDPRLSFPNNA